jgi:uncharacterized membrane protein YkvA (DUF1232 family)
MFNRVFAWTGRDDGRRAEENAQKVREGFWRKVQPLAAKLPFAEELLSAYYCAFDRNTPLRVQATLLGALAYFVMPVDFMPDLLPLLGFTDDAAVLAAALRMVVTHIQPDHRDAARAALSRFAEPVAD